MIQLSAGQGRLPSKSPGHSMSEGPLASVSDNSAQDATSQRASHRAPPACAAAVGAPRRARPVGRCLALLLLGSEAAAWHAGRAASPVSAAAFMKATQAMAAPRRGRLSSWDGAAAASSSRLRFLVLVETWASGAGKRCAASSSVCSVGVGGDGGGESHRTAAVLPRRGAMAGRVRPMATYSVALSSQLKVSVSPTVAARV